ncbi:Hypothetical predicted protein [Cloeon dipterum]|uniref:Uncharacterized protein n=1 Tax=Cloeon dipterum TaxID=197152 RepID=A0A8S1DHF6_9INSE|nr:Hypothetical predicted protein [Cloeon dipterum]
MAWLIEFEMADKFGYRPDDGDFIEACGKQYIFSRTPRFNQNTTLSFCCTKHMSAGSISTLDEAKCLAREMIKRNISDVPFWTSARPSNCSDIFTWCALDGSGEVVDQSSLQIMNKNINPKKQFVTVKANVQTESLTFEFEDPAVLARAMCSRPSPLTCTEPLCSPMGFKEEFEFSRGVQKSVVYRRGCKFIYGCNKIFDVCKEADPYYQTSRWVQACLEYRMVLVTLETQEKMECFLNLLKANKVKSGTFIVNAASFGCPKSNRWCQIPGDPFLNNSYIPWGKGEPNMDPSKECVLVNFQKMQIEALLYTMVKNVIISLFMLLSMNLKLMASVDLTCLMKEFVGMQEFMWRHADTPFNCIANCHNAFAATSDSNSRKAKYFERVFSPFQKTINCTKEERRVTASCKVKIKSLELSQLSDLPLIFFPSFAQVRRFEAEKFCSRHGLNFGIDESLMGFVTVGLPEVKIWMADVEIQNTSTQVTCQVFEK